MSGSLTVTDWIAGIEDLLCSDDPERAREVIRKIAGDDKGGPFLVRVIEHIQALILKGRGRNARNVLNELHRVFPSNWLILILHCCVVSSEQGGDAATRLFSEYIRRHPVFPHQPSDHANPVKIGNVLAIGDKDVRFAGDGFKLPSGLTESHHLLKAPHFSASLIFLDGAAADAFGEFDVIFNSVSDEDTFSAEIAKLREIRGRIDVPVVNVANAGTTHRDQLSEALR